MLKADPELKIGTIPSKTEREANPDMDLTPWETEFTTNEAGNVDTGWSQEGFNLYKKMRKEFTEHQKNFSKDIWEFQTKFLPTVTAAMEVASNKPAKKKAKTAPKEVPVLDQEFSDDDIEEMEGV